MVESEAMQLSEDTMLGSVVYGHEQMQAVINMINEIADEAGKPLWDWAPPEKDAQLAERVRQVAEQPLHEAYNIKQKQARTARIREIYDTVTVQLAPEDREDAPSAEIDVPLYSVDGLVRRGAALQLTAAARRAMAEGD